MGMNWLWVTVLVAACFWTVVHFFDTLMRSCQNLPYIWLTERLGIQLRIGQLRWTTTRCNRLFVWLGTRKWPPYMRRWFDAGAVLGALLSVPAIAVLVYTVHGNAFLSADTIPGSNTRKDGQLLSTMLPGVNLPSSHVRHYVAAFILSIVFHELGHALAAVREDIRIYGCGVFIIGVLPAAFVDIATDQVAAIHPWRQLKVFCAGIWHNFVLVLVSLLLLAALPWVLTVGYQSGNGVVVRQVKEHLAYGLATGDHVTAINDCSVTDFDSWYNCLYRVSLSPHSGFCIEDSHLLDNYEWNSTGLTRSTEVVHCCQADDPGGVCFAWLNPSTMTQKFKRFSCLPARKLLRLHSGICYSEEECKSGSSCVQPALDNTTRFIQVSRGANIEQHVLYVAQASDLYYSVSVSDYVPRTSFLPVNLPYEVQLFLKYVLSFSGALGLLNAVPCYALDGQWIALALVEFLAGPFHISSRMKKRIHIGVVAFGSLLLLGTIITGLHQVIVAAD